MVYELIISIYLSTSNGVSYPVFIVSLCRQERKAEKVSGMGHTSRLLAITVCTWEGSLEQEKLHILQWVVI